MSIQSVQKYLVCILATLFMCVIGGGYIALYSHILRERGELAEARTELAQMKQQEVAEASLGAYVERSQADIGKLQTYILSIDDPLPFLTLVEEDMARLAGVTVTVESFFEEGGNGVSAEEEVEILRERYVFVAVSAVGAWEDLYHFLAMLERVPYAVRTEKVVLVDEAKEGAGEKWKAQVSMRMLAR